MAHDLKDLLRTFLADGALGLTLRTGEHPVVYFAKERRSIEGTCPTHEDVAPLLRRLMKSREIRLFRERGVVHFKHTFEGHVELLGGARIEKDAIHVELRRMAPGKSM